MLRYVLAIFLFLYAVTSAAKEPANELVIFHMPGCRPCAHLKKMLDENPELVRGFKVSRIDILADNESAKLFNVGSVPTVVRLDDKGREVSRTVGYTDKAEFKKWLETPVKKKTMLKLLRRN